MMRGEIRVPVAAVVMAGILLKPAAFAETDMNRPTVRPVAVIPFMKQAPVIDGVVSDGEWKTFHVCRFTSQQGDLLQRREGEFWIGCDRRRLYVAVRSAVHPTAGVLVKCREKTGSRDETGVIYDDSLELWLHNAPEGGPGDYYQIMVNSAGVIFDQSFDAIEKIGRTFWRAGMEQAHKVENGVWTAEFAIDLASVNVSDPTRPLAIRVCRNYKFPWDQSRWAPLVREFAAPATMPLVRFADEAPIVSEVGFQDEKGICVAIDVANPTSASLPVAVKLGYNAESQPRYYEETKAELKPAERRRFEYRKDFFSSENYPALAEVLVCGADGTVYCHRDVKWQTRPQEPAWQPMGDAPPEEAVRFGFEFHPSLSAIRWKVDFEGMKGREDVKAARLRIRPEKGNNVLFECAASPAGSFVVAERTETLKKLADGFYVAELYLDSSAPAEKPVKSVLFQQKSDFPWLNNKIGEDDIVIPPFTPVQASAGVVKTVLREHELGDNGLWKQIVSEGRPLLAGPMRIEVVRGGRTEIASGKSRVISCKPTLAVTRAEWKTGPLAGLTEMEVECDGCARVTLTLRPADTNPVEALRVMIPLLDKEARLMHVCGDGIRFNYGGAVPTGDGLVWTSHRASRSALLGTFVPYIFVGGESRGLCWFAGNDRDWALDPEEKTAAVELRREAGRIDMVINLVQMPAPLARERRIVFGLMATPARPMPENPNWRTMGIVSGVPPENDYKIMGMCTYWGAHLYGVAPRDGDYEIVRQIAAAGRGEKINEDYVAKYLEKYPDIRNEVRWSLQGRAAGLIPYTNLRGDNTCTPEWFVFQDEWRNVPFAGRIAGPGQGGPIDFVVALTPSRVDYLLYNYRELITNGMAGIYWDNIYINANANPLTGAACRREIGGVQPEADIWRIREVTRRTAVMLHKLGKRNVSVAHMTNAQLIPAFAWIGFNLDWEWKYGTTDFQDRFTREYIRACSMGFQSGAVQMILPGITEVTSREQQAWVERTRIAVCVPHEIKVWQTDPLFGRITKAMLDMGYGTAACDVYHYWDDNPVVRIEGIDGVFLVLSSPERLMLFVSDFGNGGDCRIRLDTERLGLKSDFAAVNWEKAGEVLTAKQGAIEIADFPRHDFRLYVISKKAGD